jgi:site-specific recombinase XerD
MTQELITTSENAQPAAAYLAGLNSAVSRKVMRSQLNKLARVMGATDWHQVDWRTLNAANVMAIMARITGAPKTRNLALTGLKGVAKTAWRLGLLDSDTLARIEDVKGDTGQRELAGREIEAWEISAIIRACANDTTPAGARDAAIFAVAHKTGARRAELASASMAALTRTPEMAELKVMGKGNKQRTLYIDNGALSWLNDWLDVRGLADGPLFCAISQVGMINTEHEITTTALHKVLQKRAAEAKLENITWHDFRRTFASTLMDAGADISVVAGMMGHASVTTTARYDRRPAEAKRKAARKISTPYFKKADKAE